MPRRSGTSTNRDRRASRLSRHGLRTLDALHLAIARDLGAPLIATADRIMAKAAADLGLEVERFD